MSRANHVLTVLLLGCSSAAADGARPTLEVALRVDDACEGAQPECRQAAFWTLSIDADGRVSSTGVAPRLTFPEWRKRVAPEQLAALDEFLRREQFYRRPTQGFDCAPDFPYRAIQVVRNGKRYRACFSTGYTSLPPRPDPCTGRPDYDIRDLQAVLRVWWQTLATASKTGEATIWDSDQRILAWKQ